MVVLARTPTHFPREGRDPLHVRKTLEKAAGQARADQSRRDLRVVFLLVEERRIRPFGRLIELSLT